MRKHPIRSAFMCPLRIALTLGQVAHATSGAKSGGDGVCGHSMQNGQNSPKSGPSKNLISASQEKGAPGFRKVYSGFNTVFLSLLLLAAGVGFPAACFWR